MNGILTLFLITKNIWFHNLLLKTEPFTFNFSITLSDRWLIYLSKEIYCSFRLITWFTKRVNGLVKFFGMNIYSRFNITERGATKVRAMWWCSLVQNSIRHVASFDISGVSQWIAVERRALTTPTEQWMEINSTAGEELEEGGLKHLFPLPTPISDVQGVMVSRNHSIWQGLTSVTSAFLC